LVLAILDYTLHDLIARVLPQQIATFIMMPKQALSGGGNVPTNSSTPKASRLDRVVADAQRQRTSREQGYREKALGMYPWVCGRCAREFTRETVRELTVHHRDHNHDNNPPDGTNWELLCVYCHDNEHARYVTESADVSSPSSGASSSTSHKPFADLAELLKKS
jgi:hypothetical protein